MTLHITNGDATLTVIERAGIEGEVLPWRDVLHEGPVPAGLSLEQMSEIRAQFIADCGWQTREEARADFRARDAKLASFREYQEVILWFEHDLYDQLQLLQILDWFARQDFDDTSLSMICAGDYLGTMQPESLAALYPRRRIVLPKHLELGGRAWPAFCSQDPKCWQGLIETDTAALPFLGAAVIRHLEQYPSLKNGINRTEESILKSIQVGISKPSQIFAAAQAGEESRFMGDSLFWIYLRRMTESEPPLLRVATGGPFRLPGFFASSVEFREQHILITQAGEKVLANELDWIQISGIDKWLGGVHLTSRSAEKPSYASLRSPDSLQRTEAYASAHRTSRALPLRFFEQPAIRVFQQLATENLWRWDSATRRLVRT
jgi:hypothetical protein